MTSKTNGVLLLHYVKLCASLGIYSRNHTGVSVRKRSIWVEIGYILSRVTLKLDGWPWKTTGHLFCIKSSFVHHFKSIGEVELGLQSGNAQFGSKIGYLVSRATFEIWWMTLKNNRAPLLYHIKRWASIQSHGWIQTGITARKRLYII